MIKDIITNKEKLSEVSTKVNYDYKSMKYAKSVSIDLIDTMNARKTAMGIAAPQIGINKRIFVIYIDYKLVVFVNPEIAEIIDSSIISIEEGCLSVPDVKEKKDRYSVIKVFGYDLNGMPIRMTLYGKDSIIFQHELDHLNGIII